MNASEVYFILNQAKLLNKQQFVYDNKTKHLFLVLATHVYRNGNNRYIKLRGDLPEGIDYSTHPNDFIVPVQTFKTEYTKVDNIEMIKILYDKA